MTSITKTKGGKRKGAGRKPASFQTKTIAFRVRVEWAEVIKSTVKSKLYENALKFLQQNFDKYNIDSIKYNTTQN